MSETSKHKNQHSFKEGNKVAEKWTEKTALDFINRVHQYNIDNKDNYTLGLAIIECDQYTDIWAYITNKFKENIAVFRLIKKVEEYLESRIVNSTMSGEAKSAAMAIFVLKNKYGYEDKTKVENTDVKPEPIEFSDSASDD
jgi:hypothetical protein